MSRDVRDVRPLTGILMGGGFLLAGLAIVFVAFGWIRVDPASVHAPPWVLGLCGGMFALTGAVLFGYGVTNGLGAGARAEEDDVERDEHAFAVMPWLLGLVICAGMAAVAGWIAFGPGERTFSGSAGVGGVGVSGSGGGDTLGRWVFGFGAVLTGVMAVWGLLYGIRRLVGSGRESGTGRSP